MFPCACGISLPPDASACPNCGAAVGFDAALPGPRPLAEGEERLRCANAEAVGCGWLAESEGRLCASCGLTRVIPPLSVPGAQTAWRKFERIKKRLVFALLRMRLFPRRTEIAEGVRLEINLLADRREDSRLTEEFILTGHASGVVTLNMREINRARLEEARLEFGEKYRTALGHLRHECGHYFWLALVNGNPERLSAFRALFGDERLDYAEALRRHHGRRRTSRERIARTGEFITPYAASHPHEDWAETWAHMMHMEDGLFTAARLGLAPAAVNLFAADSEGGFDERLSRWLKTAALLNEMSAALGHRPAYPFSPPPKAVEKMRFADQIVREDSRGE